MDKSGPPPVYNQPPPSYSQVPGYLHTHTTITVTPASTHSVNTVIVPSGVGPNATRMVCPSCHADILTTVRHEPNTKTHLIALCLFCCICWPCVCLPYCMDSCQNANHYCPNCNSFIGSYQA